MSVLGVQQALEARALADEAKRVADDATVEAVKAMRSVGISYRDIGSLLGISHQRAHQLAQRG